ncbi:SH3 type 3 domain protein [Denitrovibrio acetiphilus DSM 12809]|uniref:SH3 type 3 domain protein n=1 Tax=Denitrovibrio acetiphilus (strain DSM 12809 / NBRC 114555 / N2460) TaxID=522772 RepID=D4H1D2_DENA2|nr:SH3 domain-containing protein [Denitrovibrio acetiphilus]ADD66880.1 SH3 type 3 domain protein [Denitrovibrio acetiphilus DSM 12809]
MFKKTILVILITLFAVAAFADDVVEVMGNIVVSKTYAYQEPSFKSKAMALLGKNSKVLIIGEEGEWLKVRLYNKSSAYVYAKYVAYKHENIRLKESATKVLIDIKNLLDQFNDTVQSSWFAEKQKIMPMLSFHSGKNPDDIYLLYSAVNIKGEPVPSLKENLLQKDMVKLIELIYMKMIVLPDPRYKITILVPDFVSGSYKGRTDNYAALTLDKNFANIDEIKTGTGSIWDYIRSAKRPDEIFAGYPH